MAFQCEVPISSPRAELCGARGLEMGTKHWKDSFYFKRIWISMIRVFKLQFRWFPVFLFGSFCKKIPPNYRFAKIQKLFKIKRSEFPKSRTYSRQNKKFDWCNWLSYIVWKWNSALSMLQFEEICPQNSKQKSKIE